MKRVAILVRSASHKNGNAGEALRGAVGLAAGGLDVRVVLLEDGVGALALGGEAQKALSVLRALGREVLLETESCDARGLCAPEWTRTIARDQLPQFLAGCDAVEAWR